MKKYVGGLLFLVVQNMCAMELQPHYKKLKNHKKYKKVVITPEYDEKCKLVAKYLHHYPAGRGKKEKHKIKRFLTDTRPKNDAPFKLCIKETDVRPKHTVLMWCVKKYMKMLRNIEAKETLYNIHKGDLPYELKQRMLIESLWNKAQKFYAFSNTLQFINIEPEQLKRLWSLYLYVYYFLSEINERNDVVMMFSESKPSDDISIELTELFIISLNCNIADVKEFNELISSYRTIFVMDRFNFDLPSHCKDFYSHYYYFKKEKLEELNSFLHARWDRVHVFKKELTEQINTLLTIKDKGELVQAYIDLVKSFKMHENLKHLS